MNEMLKLARRAFPTRVRERVHSVLSAEEGGRVEALLAACRNGSLERVRRGVGVILERLDCERVADWLGFDPEDPHTAVLAEDVTLATEALHHIAEAAGIVPLRRCRVCGCAECAPCGEGCWWIGEDLCSSCGPGGIRSAVKKAVRAGVKKGRRPGGRSTGGKRKRK